MDEHDRVRFASLSRYTCTRHYALENRRFHVTAELSVRMTYWYPGHKKFEILAERGPSMIRQRVLHRMLEAETEAAGDDVRESIRIIPRNYAFQLLGMEDQQGRPSYVLKVTPKAGNKFSIRGKIWLDAEDFAIVRVDAAPVQSPSTWIHNTRVIQQYQKLGLVWLPLSNHSETDSFLFGHTEVTIDSRDYEVSQTPPQPTSTAPPERTPELTWTMRLTARGLWLWRGAGPGQILEVIHDNPHRLVKVLVAMPLSDRNLRVLDEGPQQNVGLGIPDGQSKMPYFG
jgi:hypothetical protein